MAMLSERPAIQIAGSKLLRKILDALALNGAPVSLRKVWDSLRQIVGKTSGMSCLKKTIGSVPRVLKY